MTPLGANKARFASFAWWGVFENDDGNMFDIYLPRNGPTDPLELM